MGSCNDKEAWVCLVALQTAGVGSPRFESALRHTWLCGCPESVSISEGRVVETAWVLHALWLTALRSVESS